MQIKLTHNSDTNVTIAITADQATLSKVRESIVRRLAESVKIAGFRPGKAPIDIVEKHLDQQTLQAEFIDQVLNYYYSQAVIKENLRTVGQPKVDLKKFVPFDTFEFEVSVDVLGEVTLPDYKNMKKVKPVIKVDATQVNEVLSSLQNRLAEKKPVDRAAKNGDEVIIDFKGVDDKRKPVNGADGKDYPLVLGSNTFIPGFEPEVVGIKQGQEKTFTIPFPKDYGVAALQDKKVTFTITAKEINELITPKLDDAFAEKATNGQIKALKDLKDDIKKQLEFEKTNEADRAFETEVLRDIAAKTKVAVPASVVDDQILRLEQDEKQNLMYRGQTWEDHLKSEGLTEEEHREQNRKDAEEQVKIGIIIGAIGDQEKIEVTPEELEVRMSLLKGQYADPAMHAELDKPEGRQDIAARIRSEKIVTKLVGYVTKK